LIWINAPLAGGGEYQRVLNGSVQVDMRTTCGSVRLGVEEKGHGAEQPDGLGRATPAETVCFHTAGHNSAVK
jgi:hypothetical protein